MPETPVVTEIAQYYREKATGRVVRVQQSRATATMRIFHLQPAAWMLQHLCTYDAFASEYEPVEAEQSVGYASVSGGTRTDDPQDSIKHTSMNTIANGRSYTELQQQLTEAQATIQQQDQDYKDLATLINEDGSLTTHEEYRDILTDAMDAYRKLGHIEELEATIQQKNQEIVRLETRVAELCEAHEEQHVAREAAESARAHLEQEIAELKEKLALFRNQLSVQEERTGEWHRACDAAEAERDTLRQQLETLKPTTSVRVDK